MRFLVVGDGAVVGPLRALGHDVVVAAEVFPGETDARTGRPFDVRPLWRRLSPAPDALLVVQSLGGGGLAYGVEDVPAVRLYWAIDPHLNFFWQRHYARLFDLVLVTQKDCVPFFAADGVPAHWLPWGAEDVFLRERARPRTHDLAFVGTVDAATRPKRAALVAMLERRFGMATFGATAATRLEPEATADVFASARIVFNESVLGDLNFRVFEAMACGAMLVTERIENGLTDLFTPGEHLDVFGPEDLVEKIAYWLAHEDERARVAAAGARLVRARHAMRARLAEVVALVEAGVPRRDAARGASLAWGLTAHLGVVRGLAHPAAAGLAAGSLRAAMEAGEAEAAVALAEMLARADRDAGALFVLAEARRMAPRCVRARLLAAEVARRLGRADEAAALVREGVHAADVSAATRARALAAIDGGIDTADCLHALGLVVAEAGFPFMAGFAAPEERWLPRTALDYFQRALAADPTHRPAAESAAALLELVGLAEFAVPFRAAALRAAPDDAGARARLREALERSHRAHDAAP